MSVVKIPTAIRRYTDEQAEITVEGSTLREVFETLTTRHEGLKQLFFDGSGDLKRHVIVFVDGENAGEGRGLDTPVQENSEVLILPQASGGTV